MSFPLKEMRGNKRESLLKILFKLPSPYLGEGLRMRDPISLEPKNQNAPSIPLFI